MPRGCGKLPKNTRCASKFPSLSICFIVVDEILDENAPLEIINLGAKEEALCWGTNYTFVPPQILNEGKGHGKCERFPNRFHYFRAVKTFLFCVHDLPSLPKRFSHHHAPLVKVQKRRG